MNRFQDVNLYTMYEGEEIRYATRAPPTIVNNLTINASYHMELYLWFRDSNLNGFVSILKFMTYTFQA